MALTNFIVTVVAVGAAIILFRGDVKQSATVFRRNLRHIRHWLEEESGSASKYALQDKKASFFLDFHRNKIWIWCT